MTTTQQVCFDESLCTAADFEFLSANSSTGLSQLGVHAVIGLAQGGRKNGASQEAQASSIFNALTEKEAAQFSIGFDGKNSRLDIGAVDETYIWGGSDVLKMFKLDNALDWSRRSKDFVEGLKVGRESYAPIPSSKVVFDTSYPWVGLPDGKMYSTMMNKILENLNSSQWSTDGDEYIVPCDSNLFDPVSFLIDGHWY